MSVNSVINYFALKITPEEIKNLTEAQWLDICE